ncbi:MAG: UMP kinase [Pseudomonadota bacterium]
MGAWKRVLVKVSGEALMGQKAFGFDPETLSRIAQDLANAREAGVQLGVVVGGGNLVRGVKIAAQGIDRVTGDHMGMLGTVMNGLALHGALTALGIDARVLSAIPVPTMCEDYARQKAVHHLENDRIVIMVGGTGNPFFTTDTTAVLRAAETGCEAILKATNVDGIYSADPKKDPKATRFDKLTAEEALQKRLQIMDTAAFALARENGLPIVVFSIHEAKAIAEVCQRRGKFTLVTPELTAA